MTTAIHIHHVGGRNGSLSLSLNGNYAEDCHYHLYDADPTCIPQVEEQMRQRGLKGECHPYALADAVGEMQLHLCWDPYASSVYTLNPDVAGWIYEFDGVDARTSDMMSTVRDITVATSTIDEIAAKGIPVDVLTIDTEGAEGIILDGARHALDTSVVCLVCEISYFPLRAGAPLVEEIIAKARARGFVPMRFFDHPLVVPPGAPVGWRTKGLPSSGDIVFIRDPEGIARSHANPVLSLYKLAFIAICDMNMDIAAWALSVARRIGGPAPRGAKYLTFLAELQRLLAMRPIFAEAPQLIDYMTVEESFARFEGPNAVSLAFPRRRLAGYLKRVGREPFLSELRACISEDKQPAERLLAESGFPEMAEQLMLRRRKYGWQILVNFGLVTPENGRMDVNWDRIETMVRVFPME